MPSEPFYNPEGNPIQSCQRMEEVTYTNNVYVVPEWATCFAFKTAGTLVVTDLLDAEKTLPNGLFAAGIQHALTFKTIKDTSGASDIWVFGPATI